MSDLFGCMDCPPVPGAILGHEKIWNLTWKKYSMPCRVRISLGKICLGKIFLGIWSQNFHGCKIFSGIWSKIYARPLPRVYAIFLFAIE